jgi:hypothetical protein
MWLRTLIKEELLFTRLTRQLLKATCYTTSVVQVFTSKMGECDLFYVSIWCICFNSKSSFAQLIYRTYAAMKCTTILSTMW